MTQKLNAFQRLYQYRLSIATKPFVSRGFKTKRCQYCQVALIHCICQYKPSCASNASFVLLMYDDEIMKPSNTGRLIADVIDNCYPFLWSRTQPDEQLLALIADESYQPFVVFPRDSVVEQRAVFESMPVLAHNKKPLFILFDGTWREAGKMFRKSPYLNNFPILSIDISTRQLSQYGVRKAVRDKQLATAEVAAHILFEFGEKYNGRVLHAWFELFSFRYQKSVTKPNVGNVDALDNLLKLTGKC